MPFAPSGVSGIVPTGRQSINPQSSVGAASDLGYGDVGSSGPWMIEEQVLNVEYWRYARCESSGLHLNLSTVSMGVDVKRTYFWVRVTGSYSRRQSDGIYASAFETRMQQFGYSPDNTDQENVTYVSDTDSATLPASALGCDGTIYTSQPWYFRRPWVSATDSETIETTASAVHNRIVQANGTLTEDEVFQLDYAWCSPITNPLGIGTPVVATTDMPGTFMTGTYDPDEDFCLVFIPQILDTIADNIKQGLLQSFQVVTSQQIASYEKDRHDYTGLGAN